MLQSSNQLIQLKHSVGSQELQMHRWAQHALLTYRLTVTLHLHAAAFSDLHFLYCLVANCNAEYASLIVRYSCMVAQAIDAQTHKRCAGNMDAVYICAFDFLSYLQDLGVCMQCRLLDYFVRD